jgi:hypothetical protein
MNTLTAPFANLLLAGWPLLHVNAVLLNDTYEFDRIAPNPILPGNRVATSDILGNMHIIDGWARANPARFIGVAPGLNVAAAGLVTLDAPDTLFAYMDDATRFPMRTTGASFWLSWQVEGIFRL